EAIGPYSQAIKVENHIYISGCCPFNTHDGSVMGNDIETQTLKAMNNLKAIIEAAGASMDDIVKTTCFIKDIKDFPIFNNIYSSFFTSGKYPARSCVEVSRLPKDVLIEIEAIAYKK
ncbi:TPA: regulator, partial [Proteus mirabilis]|nr:regulator [Proteus mirabilis]